MAGSGAGQRQGFSAGGQSGMSGTPLLGEKLEVGRSFYQVFDVERF